MLNFRDIRPEDKGIFTDYVKPFNFENSEFSFSNLYVWRVGYQIHFALETSALYIDGIVNENRVHFQPIIIDETKTMEVMNNIVEDLQAKSGDLLISTANGYFAQLLKKYCPEKYRIKEDRTMFDYVYTSEQLAWLRGKKMHGKKNHYNKFIKTYDFEYKEMATSDLCDCLVIFDKWAEGRDIRPCDIQERQVVTDAITNMDILELSGGMIYVLGEHVAFTIGEQLNDNMAVILLEKAVPEIIGAYTAINKEYVQNQWVDKVEFINREEDMGIEGLIRAKLSYKPCKLVEKYDVYLK